MGVVQIDHDSISAFEIPLKGAKILDARLSEFYKKERHYYEDDCKKWMRQINIHDIDNETIIAALNIVRYDAVYRAGYPQLGAEYRIYNENDTFDLDFKSVYDTDLDAIKKLVMRSISFFKKQQIVKYDFTFEGGYTSLINKGDGDIATNDTLWDIKTLKPTSAESAYKERYGFLAKHSRLQAKHALQVLIYYLMGLHSKYDFYKNIKYIGLYNPVSNRAYKFNLDDISDEVKYQLSHEVIGYKMQTNNTKDWQQVDGTDSALLEKISQEKKFDLTDFNPDNYNNGIHEITKNDYLTFCINIGLHTNPKYNESGTLENGLKIDVRTKPLPSLDRSKKIYLLKTDKYKMFVSKSYSGKSSLLYGGWLKHLTQDLEWYYQNMDTYGDQVLSIFSEYWNLLYGYSAFLKRVGFDGKVHGNIVDLNFYDHMYINPLDYTIHAYMASSMTEKHLYKHSEKMIAGFGQEILEKYLDELETNKPKLMQLKTNKSKLNSLITNEMLQKKKEGKLRRYDLVNNIQITKGTMQYVHSTEMYKGSNSLRALQYVYDNGIIMKWDNLVWDSVHKKLN